MALNTVKMWATPPQVEIELPGGGKWMWTMDMHSLAWMQSVFGDAMGEIQRIMEQAEKNPYKALIDLLYIGLGANVKGITQEQIARTIDLGNERLWEALTDAVGEAFGDGEEGEEKRPTNPAMEPGATMDGGGGLGGWT